MPLWLAEPKSRLGEFSPTQMILCSAHPIQLYLAALVKVHEVQSLSAEASQEPHPFSQSAPQALPSQITQAGDGEITARLLPLSQMLALFLLN